MNAQTVKHNHYITYYNPQLREPDSVSWDLVPSMVTCSKVKRKDMFADDPYIADCAEPQEYKVNKKNDKLHQIDAGHLFNYEDASCDSSDRVECFYMSNMLPQYHSFIAGDWSRLERQERKWAMNDTLHIIAGGIGSLGKLPAGENIPAKMYKAIYMKGQWLVYIMDNSITSKGHKIEYWKRTVQELNDATGLKL